MGREPRYPACELESEPLLEARAALLCQGNLPDGTRWARVLPIESGFHPPLTASPHRHVPHDNGDIAYHLEWGFRPEALRRLKSVPIGANFHPLASELRQWLLRRGQFSVFVNADKAGPGSYTNPYTYHASTLCSILAAAVNDSHALATCTDPEDTMDVEIGRVRIHAEQTLYVARVCEALIKQLLYCTQIPKRYYERAGLGQLLSAECRGCRASGATRHKLSLLGSLAHRYRLCIEFEHCLAEHLALAGRRRNLEAAHSGSLSVNVRSCAESRAQLMVDSVALGSEFVHMLEHLGRIEERMLSELETVILRP